MLRNQLVALALAVTAAAAGVGLTACGGDEERAALAIADATRDGEAVVVTTECATDLEVEVRPDPAGSGLAQVAVWGRPEVGRCTPDVAVEGIPVEQQKLVDAATSQVVDISSR